MIFNNIIIFIIILIVLYFFSLYFSLLLPKNYYNIIEGIEEGQEMPSQNEVGTEPTNDDNYASDLSAVEIILSEYDILSDSATSANAKSAISDYKTIMEKYKGILNNKILEQESEEYKTIKTKQQTWINEMLCKFANSGIPFAHKVFGNCCIYKNNSTECHGWIDSFDGWCKKEYGENKDFDKGMPSQLVSGQKEKYAGGCDGGTLGSGGQGRAVCSTGYAGDQKLPLNSTQCYPTIGGDFDKACRDQAGNENDYKQGITSEYVFGVKTFLDDGKFGCWAGQRRAECALGYSDGKKLQPNSTSCKIDFTDWDNECRWAGGNDQGYTSKEPSQETWGMKKLYEGRSSGCISGQNRAECGKNYSGGTELKNNSTACYLWTDDFNGWCKKNYGDDWILDTRTKPDPTDQRGDWGKYKGGCTEGQGRGVCVKKTDIKPGEKLIGVKCGAWNYIWDDWCRNDYGVEFNMVGKDKHGCAEGSGRAECGKIPSGTPMFGRTCGEWAFIQDSWCYDDYGPLWRSTGKIQGDCRWGQGKISCVKK